MRLIELIKSKKYKSVSIVGLAKNAGKTVTLNYLIDEAYEKGLTLGITSTGRDGESIDLVTQTEKPTIYVTEGMFVATAKKALMMSECKVEVLETTNISTPMGEVVLVKVRQGGNIQIAGPVSAKDMKHVMNRLRFYGAEVVLVDGAIDRKAVSSPVITDACIVATGAVLSRDMKKVIEKTVHAVECYSFSKPDDDTIKQILLTNKTCIIQKDGRVIVPDIETSITGCKKINESIDKNTAYVFLKGAVTSISLKDIANNESLKNFEVIIEDGTKIFIEASTYNDLKRKGLKIRALNPIDVIAVTLNPVSPSGYYFESCEFKQKMEHFIKGIKIIDVVSGGEEY